MLVAIFSQKQVGVFEFLLREQILKSFNLPEKKKRKRKNGHKIAVEIIENQITLNQLKVCLGTRFKALKIDLRTLKKRLNTELKKYSVN